MEFAVMLGVAFVCILMSRIFSQCEMMLS